MSQSFFFLLLGLACFSLGQEHWPWVSKIGLYILTVGFAVWYLWRFFVIPFSAGMKETGSDHVDV
jgi:hypothetical protein